MAGIGTRIGIRAAQWLLEAVMMRRLPLWQRCCLAALLALIFVVPPVAAVVAVGGLKAGQPGRLIISTALVGVTAGFWVNELRKRRVRRKK